MVSGKGSSHGIVHARNPNLIRYAKGVMEVIGNMGGCYFWVFWLIHDRHSF
jgi:hypothetical protein